MTHHFQHQLSRLVPTPASQTIVKKLLASKLHEASRHPSAAVLIENLGAFYGTSTTSNGDQLWAIVRDGQPVTLFLRRSSQSSTAEAFNVSKILV